MRVGIRGCFSEWISILSGISQGSVLGPLLFLLFVNDLPDWILTSMRMFADDTKIWTRIIATTDSVKLQNDLDSLTALSSKWLLHFNPDKCKVMHIGRHQHDTKYYTVSGKKEVPLYFCLYLREILTDFQNSFKITLCCKFAVK